MKMSNVFHALSVSVLSFGLTACSSSSPASPASPSMTAEASAYPAAWYRGQSLTSSSRLTASSMSSRPRSSVPDWWTR